MLTAAQKSHFEAFGFLFLRQAFSADEIGEITREADAIWERERKGRPFGEEEQHLVRFVEQSPPLTRYVDDDRIVGGVRDLLGPDFLWAGSEGNVTMQGSHGWHADRPTESEEELAFTRLKINIYLDPVTMETGALRVLPGSHQLSFHRSLNALNETHQEMGDNDPLATPYGVPGPEVPFSPFESQPGDAVYFNQSLFHAVFNGFPGRRYIALKFAAQPTSEVHFRLLSETGGFDFEPASGFAASDRPEVRAMADRLVVAAVRAGQ